MNKDDMNFNPEFDDVTLITIKGEKGEDGKDGKDGKSLTYNDLTDEQKAEIASKSTLLNTRKLGDNLLNPNNVEIGAIQSNGTVAVNGAWAAYSTSEFIPVKTSSDYTFASYLKDYPHNVSSSRILALLFDENKNPIASSYANVTTGKITINSGNAAYIRCSWKAGEALGMLEEGANSTVYNNYFSYPVPAIDADEVIINKKGDSLTLISKLGNDEIVQTMSLNNTTRQGLFNFEQTTINPATGVTVTLTDDVAPVRINGLGTLGANHGYVVSRLALNGQSVGDIGSVWTDGTREFVLVQINSDGTGLFAPTYTETDGKIAYDGSLPAGELTHVSDAINTGAISVSGVTSAQLYPSVNNVSIKVFANEWEISGDIVESAKKIVVREDYTIISYKSLIDYARNHIGTEINIDELSGVLKVTNHYHFSAGGKCVIYATYTALENIKFMNCGIVQSAPLSARSATLYRYINGVKTVDGVDFKSNINMTSIEKTILIYPDDLTDTNKPCNRNVDTLYRDGKKIAALTLGYFPDKTKAKDENRKAVSFMWDNRATKKNYPVAFNGLSMSAGECLSVAAYRCYLDLSYTATNCNAVELGNVPYVFIDNHTAGVHKCKIGDKYVGRSINILSSEGITFNSDVIDSDGLVFTSESYGTAVITLL